MGSNKEASRGRGGTSPLQEQIEFTFLSDTLSKHVSYLKTILSFNVSDGRRLVVTGEESDTCIAICQCQCVARARVA